jgi:hypothetical protein
MFLSDGGPDFNPSHLVNSLLFYRLFKKIDADILDVMTYAAHYSAARYSADFFSAFR